MFVWVAAATFARRGTALHFAELKGRVKDILGVYGVYQRLGEDHFHPTVGSTVKAYLASHPDVEWHDWEDDPLPPEPGPGDGPSSSPSTSSPPRSDPA